MMWEVKTSPTCGLEVSKHNSRGGFNLPSGVKDVKFPPEAGYVKRYIPMKEQ